MEAFMMMHSSNPETRAEVKREAPETFKFISDLIKGIVPTPTSIPVQK
ncbi:hypothetical protein [Bacillus cereus]